DVGPGLPMSLPRGAVIADELEKLAKETEFAAGYQRVPTPQIARESLYKKSGHLPSYAESMFPPMELSESGDRIPETGKEESIRNPLSAIRYYLKPMNCPHHHKLFPALHRSYRVL